MWKDNNIDASAKISGSPAVSRNTSRRKRTSFSKEHVEVLRATFETDPYPGISLRESLSQTTGLPESRIQVWFQNRRARTLKCKGGKRPLWQSDSPLPAYNGMQDSPVQLHPSGIERPLCTPPPAYPNHIKEEMERGGLYACDASSSMSIGDDSGYYTPSYGHHQGRTLNTYASSSLLNADHQRLHNWSTNYEWGSPMNSTCSPFHPDSYACNSNYTQGFYNSPCEKYNRLQPLPPVTPDSGWWEGGLEGAPLVSGSFCGENPEETEPQESGVHHGPLSELPALSLQEILGELEGDWWQGEKLNSQSEDSHVYC